MLFPLTLQMQVRTIVEALQDVAQGLTSPRFGTKRLKNHRQWLNGMVQRQ